MTLETAKQIIENGQQNKEAEAVVRGGMNICDVLPDGRRKYQWIKVLPTKTDAESSIDAAMEKYHKKPRKTVEIPKAQDHAEQTAPFSQSPTEEVAGQTSTQTLVERLKKKAIDLWREIDSIVIE